MKKNSTPTTTIAVAMPIATRFAIVTPPPSVRRAGADGAGGLRQSPRSHGLGGGAGRRDPWTVARYSNRSGFEPFDPSVGDRSRHGPPRPRKRATYPDSPVSPDRNEGASIPSRPGIPAEAPVP